MRCRYSSASGGFGLLVPSDWAVICSAKLLRNYMIADFIKRYINEIVILFTLSRPLQNSLLTIFGVSGIHSVTRTNTGRPCSRSQLVQSVLKRLTMADASNFYNLASLESSVYTLLRLTSK